MACNYITSYNFIIMYNLNGDPECNWCQHILLILRAMLDKPDEGVVVKHPVVVNRSSSEHLINFLVSEPGPN